MAVGLRIAGASLKKALRNDELTLSVHLCRNEFLPRLKIRFTKSAETRLVPQLLVIKLVPKTV